MTDKPITQQSPAELQALLEAYDFQIAQMVKAIKAGQEPKGKRVMTTRPKTRRDR